MKIFILTLPLHANYGGILQAYSLQTVLQRMGHDVMIISRPLRLSAGIMAPVKYVKRAIWKYFFKRSDYVFLEKRYNCRQTVMETNTIQFINNNIRLRTINSFKDISNNDCDAIIVGSDQVWRPVYFCGMFNSKIGNAYLRFAEDWNIKRIAYAPSFGTDNWEYDEIQTEACRGLLQHFDAVSVREESGVELCKKYFTREDVEWVLDPTMLLTAEDYKKLIPLDVSAKGNLMYYVLEDKPEIDDLINVIAGKYTLTPFKTNANTVDASSKDEVYPQPPVEQWLAGFRDASFVVTDSFHACVFCILFHKPFVVIGNKGRGYSRFKSLLQKFGIENRLIEDVSQFNEDMLKPLPEMVYNRLEENRKVSMLFLQRALES